jgi:hypothetical protein
MDGLPQLFQAHSSSMELEILQEQLRLLYYQHKMLDRVKQRTAAAAAGPGASSSAAAAAVAGMGSGRSAAAAARGDVIERRRGGEADRLRLQALLGEDLSDAEDSDDSDACVLRVLGDGGEDDSRLFDYLAALGGRIMQRRDGSYRVTLPDGVDR